MESSQQSLTKADTQALAGKSQNKAMVGQLTAIGIPAMTLALLSGVSLLASITEAN